MTIMAIFRDGRKQEYRRVDRFAQSPTTIHLLNINGLPIAIIPLDALESLHIPEHESEIQVIN